MVERPQSVSPVTSPRTSSTEKVFGPVEGAVNRRLGHTVKAHNSHPNVIAQGRAPKPYALVSNEMAAVVRDYEPPPGKHLGHSMRLEFQNKPQPRVDQIIDAIQRYLDIRPRREPRADPLDEASVARHPQQILQSNARWDQALWYQMAHNGVKHYQFQPDYRTWQGRLGLELENPGSANIYTPSSRQPRPGREVSPTQINLEAPATQEVGSLVLESQSTPMNYFVVGHPNYVRDPYFEPNHVARNTMVRIQELTNVPKMVRQNVGPPTFSDRPSHQPAHAASVAMESLRENISRYSSANFIQVSPDFNAPGGNAWQNSLKISQNAIGDLSGAGATNSQLATVASEGYKKAMKTIDSLNIPSLGAISGLT